MSDEKVPPRIRSRQCMFVLYPESQQQQIEYCQQNFPCAWALHDKDVYRHDADDGSHKAGDPKKPHVHFVCRFANARYFTGIASELDVPVNTINKVNNLYKAYRYLWHADTDDEKFKYPASIVGTHEFDEPSEHYGMSACEDEQVSVLLDMPRFSSIREMSLWAYENGCWKAFRDNYAMWRDHFREMQESPCSAPAVNDTFKGMYCGMKPLLPKKDDPF